MLRKALVVVVLVVLWSMLRRGGPAVGFAAGWLAFVYVCWRAWPSVRADLGRLRGLVFRPGARGF